MLKTVERHINISVLMQGAFNCGAKELITSGGLINILIFSALSINYF
jgi:hypothetical protein